MELDEYAEKKLEKQDKLNAYDKLIIFQGAPGPLVRVKGYEEMFIQLASNDYLGLAGHPEMIDFSVEGTYLHGTGTGAVRTLVGTTESHIELEEKLVEFKGVKDKKALVFSSGYTANLGAFSIFHKSKDENTKDFIISEELNHASIIDAIRLAKAVSKDKLDIAVPRHLDMAHLEEILKDAVKNDYEKIGIVTDGVFSMLGEIAPLDKIVALVEKYSKGNVLVIIDDAHGTGVLGKNGRGTPEYHNVEDKIDILIGTLSKANGVVGGYVISSKTVRDYMIANARPMLFSASLPPGTIYAVIKSLELMNDNSLRERMWKNSDYFKMGLKHLGYNIGQSVTPITPVIVGSEDLAKDLSNKLWENHIIARPILFPMVAKGSELVRNIITAAHTIEIIDKALEVYNKVGKELGII